MDAVGSVSRDGAGALVDENKERERHEQVSFARFSSRTWACNTLAASPLEGCDRAPADVDVGLLDSGATTSTTPAPP